MEPRDMLKLKKWAVIGVSQDASRYSYRIFMLLNNKRYEVYAVNPNHDKVDGEICYPAIDELPVVPDVVCMVVNPNVGRSIIERAHMLGVKNVWLQPGTFDDGLLRFIDSLGMNYVTACVLVQLGG